MHDVIMYGNILDPIDQISMYKFNTCVINLPFEVSND